MSDADFKRGTLWVSNDKQRRRIDWEDSFEIMGLTLPFMSDAKTPDGFGELAKGFKSSPSSKVLSAHDPSITGQTRRQLYYK